MIESLSFVPATEGDLDAIRTLLVDCELPTAGIEDHWRTFIVVRDGEKIIGCGGAETYPSVALLRSIAVAELYQGGGVGRRIVRELLDRLASRGIREFYLLTETAEAFFKKRGFRTIDRDQVNPLLMASREFQDACPKSATCMRLLMLT